jgi:hypothetical protein
MPTKLKANISQPSSNQSADSTHQSCFRRGNFEIKHGCSSKVLNVFMPLDVAYPNHCVTFSSVLQTYRECKILSPSDCDVSGFRFEGRMQRHYQIFILASRVQRTARNIAVVKHNSKVKHTTGTSSGNHAGCQLVQFRGDTL